MKKKPTDRAWIEKLLDKSFKELGKNPNDLTDLQKSEILNDILPKIAAPVKEHFLNNSDKNLRSTRKKYTHFKKNLFKKWQKGINLLEACIHLHYELGESIRYTIIEENLQDIKHETICRIHARACQIGFEILELLKGGFADGALARWRTLYEISIIAEFLRDKDEYVFQQYVDHITIESHDELVEYQKNCTELGFPPLSQEEVDEIEKEKEKLLEKYGKEFCRAQYGWTYNILPKDKRNFRGIEETVGMSHYRSLYKWANNNIHSGPKSMFNRLGLYSDNILLAGVSNYGLTDPAQFTAFSLLDVSNILSDYDPYLESDVYLEVAKQLISDIGKTFHEIQKEIERESDELN